MNFVAREQLGLGQKALHEVYAKEEVRKGDIVDYALLDTMHETKDIRYGKPYKKRELEPSMYDLLTGGYVTVEDEAKINQHYFQNLPQMSEEEMKEYQDALMRKEIAKGKWMTETRDNFRKFTDDPEDNVYYIGNHLMIPNRYANNNQGHYLTSYKRDFGDDVPEDNDGNEQQIAQPVEEVKEKNPKRVTSKSPSKEVKSVGRTQSRDRRPKKKKKVDMKRWIYERNKAKYGKPLPDKSKMTKEEREQYEKMWKEISISRWKPDTHTRSLYGKPIFHPYGKGNTNPTVGGVVYGQYMLTHNIHPHVGDNCPTYHQVYDSAHNKAFENGKPILEPTREVIKPEELTQEQVEELKHRNPTMPGAPARELKRHVKQLDLMNEVCFASKHSTSAPSDVQQSEVDRRETPHKSPSVTKVTKQESNHLTTKQRNQSAKPSTLKAPVGKENLSSTHKVNSPAQVQNNAANGKRSSLKPQGNNATQNTENMRTMASTGKLKITTAQQPKPLFDTKTPTEKNTKALQPQQTRKSSAQVPKEEVEVGLGDDFDRDDHYEGYEQRCVHHQQDETNDVNPTVFPVGFPF